MNCRFRVNSRWVGVRMPNLNVCSCCTAYLSINSTPLLSSLPLAYQLFVFTVLSLRHHGTTTYLRLLLLPFFPSFVVVCPHCLFPCRLQFSRHYSDEVSDLLFWAMKVVKDFPKVTDRTSKEKCNE